MKVNKNLLKKALKSIKDKLGKIPTRSEYSNMKPSNLPNGRTLIDQGFKWSDLINETFGKEEKSGLSREDIDNKGSSKQFKNIKKYVVTTAVAGQEVNTSFLKSLEMYCRSNNAKLIILGMRGFKKEIQKYDPILEKYKDSIYSEFEFNKNLLAIDLRLTPQQINPIGGIDRLGKKSHSIIMASPKQQMKSIPTSNQKSPHIIHSTGALTNAKYNDDRAGKLAHQDHKVGALIVEIKDDLFFLRQIQANDNGSFYDLNKHISPSQILNNQAEAFVFGDIHVGETDIKAFNAFSEVVDLVNPKHIILHDVFSGNTVSHHVENNIDQKTKNFDQLGSLEVELYLVGEFLEKLSKKYKDKKLVIVKSNHDEFLDRYLTQGRYITDFVNYRLALDLAILKYEKKNPISEYLKSKDYKLNNLIWLERDEDFKIGEVQLGCHGDLGANGSRGSGSSIEVSYGNAIIGHSHSPNILRDTWTVGTTTYLKLPYTRGPSSWLHASCILHKDNKKQMIIVIDGSWK
jgi:hypothetical protein